MTKLVPIGVLVAMSFVLCVAHTFKLPNNLDDWMDLYDEEAMFKGTNKQVRYLETVYPSSKIDSIGQVGGLDTTSDGNLLVFHRADRVWDFDSFRGNNFNRAKYGAIEGTTIDLIDTKSMKKIASWGENKFYMPHGLTVDHNGKVWLTDVGLHQVFKFDLNNMDQPELVLGEAFKLGSDSSHFCKPTDVAASSSNGHIFVSDGYCNDRVVEFDSNGKYIKSFQDAHNPLVVAHSITLVEPLNLVCTVSREQGRIVCFDMSTGDKVSEIVDEADMRTVYAIRYDAANRVLHAATGENRRRGAGGLTFDATDKSNFGKLIQKWDADERDLSRVHDITTSPKGSRIFLGQLNSEIDEFSFE